MGSLRTLKKRRPKQHVNARVTLAPTRGHRAKSLESALGGRGTTLSLTFCFALLLALVMVTQGQAEDYYLYQTPNGELVISNKEPPPGAKS